MLPEAPDSGGGVESIRGTAEEKSWEERCFPWQDAKRTQDRSSACSEGGKGRAWRLPALHLS
jgi:hypothetical protein